MFRYIDDNTRTPEEAALFGKRSGFLLPEKHSENEAQLYAGRRY